MSGRSLILPMSVSMDGFAGRPDGTIDCRRPLTKKERAHVDLEASGRSIVVFDSQTPISTGQAVYMSAVAGQVTGAELERGIAIFSRRALAHGGREWTVADVSEPAPLRLYRATVSAHFMLDKSGEGPRYDHRTPVQLTRAG